MRYQYITVILFICLASTFVSCSIKGRESLPSGAHSSSVARQEPSASQPFSQESGEQSNTFDSVITRYDEHTLVRDNEFANPLANIELMEAWVEDYRMSKPGTVAVLSDGMGYPAALYVIESDGSATYTITVYNRDSSDGSSAPPPAQVYESSQVVERMYDYVLGADFPADVKRNVIVIHKTTRPVTQKIEWNPESDALFAGITPHVAQQRAKEQEEKIYRHMNVISNIYGGGVFLRESILEKAGAYTGPEYYYKTVGAINIDEHICYIVYGNTDKEALSRGEHGGSVTAVSLDGRLVFIQSMVDGSWIFVDDAQQALITPESAMME